MAKQYNPQISVIVPVYNTSKYLVKCLKSITTQPVQGLEIIIVNDCSTDNSLQIINKIAFKDNRIIVINKKTNEGLELARRSAISIAKGNYIYHVDSDDWLVPNTLNYMLQEALIFDADIVSANFYRTLDGFGIIKQKSKLNLEGKSLVTKEDFIIKYYKSFFGYNVFSVSMWGKLYKRSFINKLHINLLGNSLGEDLNYNIQVFPQAEKILFVSNYVYNYRFGGMTSKFNDGLMIAAIKMYNIKKTQIKIYKLYHLDSYIIIELKNFFRFYLESLVKFRSKNLNSYYSEIKTILESTEFKDLFEYFSITDVKNDEFTKVFLEKDLPKLLDLSMKKVKSEIWKNRLKKILSRLLPK